MRWLAWGGEKHRGWAHWERWEASTTIVLSSSVSGCKLRLICCLLVPLSAHHHNPAQPALCFPCSLLLSPPPPALALDLGSPLVPGAFLLLASAGSIARAAVGMAGGATHTALTQHFAIANNAAEVSAKADARERACNIVGSLVGMALTHCLAGGWGRWQADSSNHIP
jgi:hypothetical protein